MENSSRIKNSKSTKKIDAQILQQSDLADPEMGFLGDVNSRGANTKPFKSGFVALIGRPNAGKSTLINAIMGKKIAITSNTAQTTRHRFRAIHNTPNSQIILVDTPGLHKPHDALGEELNASAIKALEDVDIVAMLIDAGQSIGKGDKWVASQLACTRAKKICVLTKTDICNNKQIEKQRQAALTLLEDAGAKAKTCADGVRLDENINDKTNTSALANDTLPIKSTSTNAWFNDARPAGNAKTSAGFNDTLPAGNENSSAKINGAYPAVNANACALVDESRLSWDAMVGLSSVTGKNVDAFLEEVEYFLPVGPAWFPRDMDTDQPFEVLIAEFIREKILRDFSQEIPHAIGVQVEEMTYNARRDTYDIYANIYVERASQKGIIIGCGGAAIKKIGTQARLDLQQLLGCKVFLDLHVRVKKNWRRDINQIRRFGYGEGM